MYNDEVTGWTTEELNSIPSWVQEFSGISSPNGKLLHSFREERNILHKIKRRKANWIGHTLRRNCLLKHVIEGKLEGRIEMTVRRERRRKQLLDNHNDKRRY
jgi:hypothetical protein